MKVRNSSNLPVSSFYIKTKSSVNGVSMPLGAFFQKEHFSIPLQMTILNSLKKDTVHIYALRHPILRVCVLGRRGGSWF